MPIRRNVPVPEVEKEQDLIQSIYATTLDPAQLDATVRHWVEQVAHQMITQPSREDARLEGHLNMAFDLLERQSPDADVTRATPVLELAETGDVRIANLAAQQEFGERQCLHLDALPFDAFARSEVRRALSERLPAGSATPVRAILAERSDLPERLLLTVQRNADGLRLCASPVAWTPAVGTLLQDAFGLTTSESEVARLLSRGWNVERVSESRRTSIATVRSQIRAIYSKTGISSLPELVHLIVGLGVISFGDDVAPTPPDAANVYPRARDRALLQLADGRLLDYAVFGAEDGEPVLYLHDEICGDGWTAADVEMLTKRGLKIIAPLRPSYGRTQPLPPGTNMPLRQVAEDVFALLDELGIARVPVLARVMGNATAFYLMATQPDRVERVVSVCPPLPMDDETYAQLNPLLRLMMYASVHNPTLARFVLKVRLSFLQRYGADRFLRTHFHDPHDQALLERRDVRAAIEHGSKATTAKGYQGFLSDLAVGERFTPESLAARLCRPVTFVVGEHDRNHRKARAAAVVAISENAQLVELPDASELVFYRHTQTILDLVKPVTG